MEPRPASYRVTLTRLDAAPNDQEPAASFVVATAVEALRVAEEGVAIARRHHRSVVYEVHDAEERLVVSYSSTGANS